MIGEGGDAVLCRWWVCVCIYICGMVVWGWDVDR